MKKDLKSRAFRRNPPTQVGQPSLGTMSTKTDPPSPRRELIREELLKKAAEVFEAKGYAQTRIHDVAQALDLSRSALYHYFKSKDEILAALVEEHTTSAADRLERTAASQEGSALDRLRELLSTFVDGRLSGGARLRVLDQLAAEMPPDIKEKFEHGRRRILAIYSRLIEDGIAAGEIRPMDSRTAALAVLGIASWTSWWYSPGGRRSPQELSDQLVDIAFHGLTRSDGGRSLSKDPKAMIRSITADLKELERELDSALSARAGKTK